MLHWNFHSSSCKTSASSNQHSSYKKNACTSKWNCTWFKLISVQTIICWQCYYRNVYSITITYHEESVQWRRLVQVALEHHTVAAGCAKTQGGADWRGERHREFQSQEWRCKLFCNVVLLRCFALHLNLTTKPLSSTTSNPSGARGRLAHPGPRAHTKRLVWEWNNVLHVHVHVQRQTRIFAGKGGKWTLLCPNRELMALWSPNTSDNTSV